jgi:hypothetical protein
VLSPDQIRRYQRRVEAMAGADQLAWLHGER